MLILMLMLMLMLMSTFAIEVGTMQLQLPPLARVGILLSAGKELAFAWRAPPLSSRLRKVSGMEGGGIMRRILPLRGQINS
jgi:hypothetical protein